MINQKPNIIPDNKILIVPENKMHRNDYLDIVEPLKGHKTREWVNNHVLHCLPVVIGNQYGFAIRSDADFTAEWNGGDAPSDVTLSVHNHSRQIISSHFGSGLITVQNRFTFRTPPGINLMVLDPPNYFIPNLINMFAVVETDNLRRDFTFNLKITKPNVTVNVKKGDFLSAIIPIPRYFVDNFEIDLAENYFSEEVLEEERFEMQNAGKERSGPDRQKPHGVGKRYWRGEDTQGNKFSDHQRKIT
jgi:hypothetical protein